MGELVAMVEGVLQVPRNPVVHFIEGDGIGAEIWDASVKVFDAAVAEAYAGEVKIDWVEVLAGEKAVRETGEYLPAETVEALKRGLVSIKGPLGTPTGGGFRSLNVTLRQQLDLFACVRPIRYFEGVPSPVKNPEDVDVVIFRENTEDIYSGIEWDAGSPEAVRFAEFISEELGVKSLRNPGTTSFGVKPISEEGSKRLIRAAISHAVSHGLKTVTIIHKGNIQKFTEGGFLRWGYEVAESEFSAELAAGTLVVNDMIADNFFQQVLLYPSKFDVVALTNLNGDYASDAVAAQVGGIGIAPGANINYVTGHAVFEATHGTAPDIAGKDLANPSSLLLSGVMLLDYLGLTEAGRLVTGAIEDTIRSGQVTGDFAHQMPGAIHVGTAEFAGTLIQHIREGRTAGEVNV